MKMKRKQIIFLILTSNFIIFSFCIKSSEATLLDPFMVFDSEFEAEVERLMIIGHMPTIGFSAVYENETYYSKIFGNKTAVDTPFYMLSTAKPITATAIFQLQEQGLLDIDDDINDYLPYELNNPYFPETPVTIKHLLTHTSTLSEKLDHLYMILYGDLNYPSDIYDIFHVDGACYDESNWINARPGSSLTPSDVGYDILALIIENITGDSFYNYAEENILIPLSMTNTKYKISDYPQESFDYSYGWNDTIDELIYYDYFNASCIPGAGGFLSTVDDMATFLLSHMNGGTINGVQILEESTVELMFTEDPPSGRGLGWRLNDEVDDITNLNGAISGNAWGSKAYMLFKNKIGVILLINQEEFFAVQIRLFGHIFRTMETAIIPETETTNTTLIAIISTITLYALSSIIITYAKKRVKN